MRIEEAAVAMQLNEQTVRRYAREGRLPGARRIGGQWRVHPDELEAGLTKLGGLPKPGTVDPKEAA